MKKIMLFFPVLFCGCTATRLPPVIYDRPVSLTSTKIAKIELMTGNIVDDPGKVIYIPNPAIPGDYMTSGGVSKEGLDFGIIDQKSFLNSLSNELVRINIVSAVLESTSTQKGDINIKLIFESSIHNAFAHEYILDVKMEIASIKKVATFNYHIVSSEGDSWWAGFANWALRGKKRAANKLIHKIIPDIESFLRL